MKTKKVDTEQLPHVHAKGQNLTNDKIETEWSCKYTLVSISEIYAEIVKEMNRNFEIIDMTTVYHFDKDAGTKYYKVEMKPNDDYPDTIIRVDIFSCYCDDTTWKTGKPPF